jgi:hypothetical protein
MVDEVLADPGEIDNRAAAREHDAGCATGFDPNVLHRSTRLAGGG